MAARSKAWTCGRSLVGIVGSNQKKKSRRRHGCLSLVNVLCSKAEVSATGWSLVQRSPTECGVSKCDREASIMRKPWPTRGSSAIGEKIDISLRMQPQLQCCSLNNFVFPIHRIPSVRPNIVLINSFPTNFNLCSSHTLERPREYIVCLDCVSMPEKKKKKLWVFELCLFRLVSITV